ncbi:MAG TPA: YitT family protein [Chitinophagaceae bacterium]|nr:YitT family protein [Chitinophagaceae bacterium]MCB9054472.1 YitT family protein [Chitinophagales bacterium]HPG10680.1 YitT family protein [Chitinophagaceae bacterium]
MRYDDIYEFMISKLEKELSDKITYHNVAHTISVINASAEIGEKEGITDREMVLLKTAALFHDTGFLKIHIEHEEQSCIIARKYLPEYGYTKEDIREICTMIMATRLPQTPVNHLSKIICDADLFYLGTDRYDELADNLYKEFASIGKVNSREDWLQMQEKFLSSHVFFTKSARDICREKKLMHLAAVRNAMAIKASGKKGHSYTDTLQDAILIVAGVIIASIALKRFLVPNHFFDGGITGISLLIHEIYHFNLAFAIVLLNLPLVAISYFSVGKSFAFKAFISVVLLGIALILIPGDPVTSDKLLISIFGGVFLGTGVGLVMRGGAALDGIEVLALYTLKRTSFTISEIILGINILIFSIAAMRFGIETALYSILTYFAATRSIDYVVEGLQAFTGVTIISGKSEEIKSVLVNKLGRGITVYKGERGFLPGKFEVSTECDIIFTVITRLELRKLRNLVHETDPKAFVFANTIKEASGGILKRRHNH